MPDTYTTNLNLTKPEVGGSANTWGNKLNSNLDTIDGLFTKDGTTPVLRVTNGGTGASTAAGARANLGLGDLATQNSSSVTVGNLSASGNVTVAGQIYCTGSGYKFPDGSVQTKAAETGAQSWTAVSSATTLQSNKRYFVTAGSITLTLPASPSDGDWIELVGVGVSNVTLARNGKKIMGLSEDLVCNIQNFIVKLVYHHKRSLRLQRPRRNQVRLRS